MPPCGHLVSTTNKWIYIFIQSAALDFSLWILEWLNLIHQLGVCQTYRGKHLTELTDFNTCVTQLMKVSASLI